MQSRRTSLIVHELINQVQDKDVARQVSSIISITISNKPNDRFNLLINLISAFIHFSSYIITLNSN